MPDVMVLAIEAERVRRGMNDAELSRLLGIPVSTWHRTKNGERRVGIRLLQAVARNMPELRDVSRAYLTKEGS